VIRGHLVSGWRLPLNVVLARTFLDFPKRTIAGSPCIDLQLESGVREKWLKAAKELPE
jgi:hypothetical protein